MNTVCFDEFDSSHYQRLTFGRVLNVKETAIKFAEMHTKEALAEAERLVRLKGENISTCNLILNSYPSTNIR